MRQRELGNSGFSTSAIGLGCMGFSQGYGAADDQESRATIHRALDLGIRLLDTAMSYGQGHNETLLGSVLRERRDPPEQVHIATKFGIVREDTGVRLDGNPENVRGYCESSLSRLGVDVIDLYYLHRVDPQVPIADTVAAMAQLVADGKVRHLGVCEVTTSELREACAVHPIAAVQFEWSLLWREPEGNLIPAARECGVGIVPYSPLGRGLLTATLNDATVGTSEFRRTDPRFQSAELTANLTQVEALRRVAATMGVTAGQLALAWLLAAGEDVVPIPGTRHVGRIEENAAAADIKLDSDDLQNLAEAIPADGWRGDRRSFAVPTTVRPAGGGVTSPAC